MTVSSASWGTNTRESQGEGKKVPYRSAWKGVLSERRNLFSFALVSMLFAMGMGMTAWTLSEYRAKSRIVVELQEAGAQIRYYDEVLTMSARMGALTEDLAWERRYDEVEPRLDQALARASAGRWARSPRSPAPTMAS